MWLLIPLTFSLPARACVQGNALTGELPPVMPYNKIYTAHLACNMFTLISAGAHHVTDLNLAYNL